MNILQAVVSVLAFCVSATASANPIPENQESAMGLRSFDLPAEQTGSFEVSFDVTPLADKIDVFTGNASPNLGDPARCTPNMAYELVVENGKLAGTLDDTFTVVNPIRCGYGSIPLKH